MLTVRSSVVSRAIPYKEVAFVAKTAQEQALTGVEEPPQETGICERFVDTIFCGGVKKTAKSRIHGMSHHTASLHLELQKPSEERNSGLIKTHIEKISENQKRLYGLMQGDTLEFGSVEERPVVGKDSYLIHRSPAKICPTGIPLYKPEHEDYSSIPTFKSAADIRAEDIPAIRHSGKTSNQGMINCEGAIYQIHFSELNTPEIIYSMEDQQCESLQRRLYELWQTNERHFSFNPPEQSVSHVVSAPDPFALSEILTPISIVPAVEVASEVRATPPLKILKFETCKKIEEVHFEQIQSACKFICGDKVYQVRFDKQDEPILLCDDSDPSTNALKITLFQIWIHIQVRRAQRQLYSLHADVEFYFPFPDTESELFRIRAGRKLDIEWDKQVASAKLQFKKVAFLLQRNIEAEKSALLKNFDMLISNGFTLLKQRGIYSEGAKRLTALQARQDTMQSNIDEFKEIYCRLFQLARDCRTKENQKIILDRIKNFAAYLKNFAESPMAPSAVAELNWVMKNQFRFIKGFSSVHLKISELLFDQIEIALVDGVDVQLPESALLKELRNELSGIASNPFKSWQRIQETMDAIKKESGQLAKKLRLQMNSGLELDEIIRSFKEHNGEVLNLETQLTYYTPRTYSRIVTLMGIRTELLNKYQCLEEYQVIQKIKEYKEHLVHIRKETAEIEAYEQSDGFEAHQMYAPEQNVGSNTPMNYSQWCDDQKGRELG